MPPRPSFSFPTLTTNTVDNTVNIVCHYSSITIGADGLPLISYHDATTGDLKVAHCSDITCSSAPPTPHTITVLDNFSSGNVGRFTSITIGGDGYGLISYYDLVNGDLLVVHCTTSNLLCDDRSAAPSRLDGAVADVGQFTSVTIGRDGLPLISYYDVTNQDLKVAHCNDAECNPLIADISPIHIGTDDSGKYTSVTIGQDGLGVISYYNIPDPVGAPGDGELNVAHCANLSCNSANALTSPDSDASTDVGQFTSVTIGQDGFPVVTYYDATSGTGGNLKVAHCSNAICSGVSTVSVLDSSGDVGKYTSVTIGVDGMPLITYQAAGTANDLKVAHCSNSLCIPYFRRR